MTIVIGLTGSIASGKSTIARIISEWDIPIIDADVISREVVEAGEEAYQEIVRVFGENVLQSDQSLDRKKLGQVIFKDAAKREQLNKIVHPAVRKKMLRQRDNYVEAGESAVVLDIPLLFESKLTHLVDKVLVVFVNEQTQLKRLMGRNNFTREEAEDRISSQISMEDKAAMADKVINNNGTIEESKRQLESILEEWHVKKSG
ncbi:dephospho-CoA kinase [Sediminibacillus albus]|uniref:Dephospho-CoA kinase n=1 Tax=Sediminibacillus albus TaxID=407036 RepID=A0A1G9BTI8_9BACI|nr:dephospho-CoA kinase [Sediminibacillus albus]SDK42620.1 dephospho-CoA kinase [Sediminibacillus albus]